MEALNEGLSRCRGRYLHIMENDFIYLDGWDRYVLDRFRRLPNLGQLSILRGPAWLLGAKHEGLVILSRANVGSASVIPCQVIFEHGIRFETRKATVSTTGMCHFSAKIRALELLIAWPDKELAINVGHQSAEFARDPDYYIRNYRMKLFTRTRLGNLLAPTLPRPLRRNAANAPPGAAFAERLSAQAPPTARPSAAARQRVAIHLEIEPAHFLDAPADRVGDLLRLERGRGGILLQLGHVQRPVVARREPRDEIVEAFQATHQSELVQRCDRGPHGLVGPCPHVLDLPTAQVGQERVGESPAARRVDELSQLLINPVVGARFVAAEEVVREPSRHRVAKNGDEVPLVPERSIRRLAEPKVPADVAQATLA